MIFAVVLEGVVVLKLIFWLPAFNEAFDESAAEPDAEVPYEVELVACALGLALDCGLGVSLCLGLPGGSAEHHRRKSQWPPRRLPPFFS